MGGTAIVRRASACLRPAAICLLGSAVAASGAGANSTPHHHPARPAHHLIRPARAAWRPTRSAAAPCAHADTPATAAPAADMDRAVDCLVNQQRLRFGLPPLQVSPDLNHSAQGWTDQMVATGNFTHGGDSALSQRLLDSGFHWGQAGENIATGYLTPRDAVAGWMASPDHCRNILDPGYREMGTGVNPAAVGTWASGAATWTQDMGLLIRQNPLSHSRAAQDGCPYTVASSPGS